MTETLIRNGQLKFCVSSGWMGTSKWLRIYNLQVFCTLPFLWHIRGGTSCSLTAFGQASQKDSQPRNTCWTLQGGSFWKRSKFGCTPIPSRILSCGVCSSLTKTVDCWWVWAISVATSVKLFWKRTKESLGSFQVQRLAALGTTETSSLWFVID